MVLSLELEDADPRSYAEYYENAFMQVQNEYVDMNILETATWN